MNNLLFPHLPKRKDQGNIWLISDIHGWHKNIAKGSSSWGGKDRCRDFENEDLMTRTIVDNTNVLVKPDDYLISLGDWSFAGYKNVKRLRDSIVCKNIYHVMGNHDQNIQRHEELQTLFSWVGWYLEFSYEGRQFICSHYPFESWNDMGRGAIMCYGHCHQSLKHKMNSRFDFGVEGTNYRPINALEVIKWAAKEGAPKEIDHHS